MPKIAFIGAGSTVFTRQIAEWEALRSELERPGSRIAPERRSPEYAALVDALLEAHGDWIPTLE